MRKLIQSWFGFFLGLIVFSCSLSRFLTDCTVIHSLRLFICLYFWFSWSRMKELKLNMPVSYLFKKKPHT